MKIIYNSIIPFQGFKAMNLFGVLFARKGEKVDKRTLIHETIHQKQMLEMLVIGFYAWYLLEWLFRVLLTKDRFSHQAYRNLSLEREAYDHEADETYLQNRELYKWMTYFFNN